MTTPFRTLIRVRYAECDAQNVVFNARYAEYADVVATEFYRQLFGGYDVLLKQGLDNQVVRMVTDWHAPARFDDVLAVSVSAGKLGNSSFALHFAFSGFDSAQPIADMEIVYVMVDANTFRKKPIPATVRERLKQGAPGVTVDLAAVQQP